MIERTALAPQRYFEKAGVRAAAAEHAPICVYLETTNRCNLLCTTCPRTYEELEPPADMSWELFRAHRRSAARYRNARCCMASANRCWSRALPRMVRYLKDRGTYVLFNTNGTVLNERNGRALIDAELDELRVSLDAANARILHGGSRQELLQPHPQERAGFSRSAGTRRQGPPARIGLADGPERDNRRTAGVRAASRPTSA